MEGRRQWETALATKSRTIEFGNGVFADSEGTGSFTTELNAGQSMKVQYCFQVKNGAELKSFTLREGDEGRKFTWDLGGVKAEFAAATRGEGE